MSPPCMARVPPDFYCARTEASDGRIPKDYPRKKKAALNRALVQIAMCYGFQVRREGAKEAGNALQRWRYRGGGVEMSTIKKFIFSVAASLLSLLFVVPLLGHMNVVESVGGSATVIVVTVLSVSAAGLTAEATTWGIENWTRLTTPKSKGQTATTQQSSPVATPVERPTVPEQQDVSMLEKEQLLARIEALETRLKEMNNGKPEQQTVVAPAPMVVAATAKPTPVQQQQQKKNHVDVILGGAS